MIEGEERFYLGPDPVGFSLWNLGSTPIYVSGEVIRICLETEGTGPERDQSNVYLMEKAGFPGGVVPLERGCEFEIIEIWSKRWVMESL